MRVQWRRCPQCPRKHAGIARCALRFRFGFAAAACADKQVLVLAHAVQGNGELRLPFLAGKGDRILARGVEKLYRSERNRVALRSKAEIPPIAAIRVCKWFFELSGTSRW